VDGHTYVRPVGQGALVRPFRAEITLPALLWKWIDAPGLGIDSATRLRRTKLLRFLRQARLERDAGQAAPQTAHERWILSRR
jgi:hypothetical protein